MGNNFFDHLEDLFDGVESFVDGFDDTEFGSDDVVDKVIDTIATAGMAVMGGPVLSKIVPAVKIIHRILK